MARKDPCIEIIKRASGNTITDEQAKELIDGIMAQADQADNIRFANLEEKVRALGREMIDNNKLAQSIQRRNSLLSLRVQRKIEAFIDRFPTLGEGILAYMNRSPRQITGARFSAGAQIDSLQAGFIGELATGLRDADLVKQFRGGDLDWEIFQELWHINDPTQKNPSGSRESLRIAQIIDNIQSKMVPRENRGGSFIRMLDNYVMRQTHDPIKIRRAGGMGFKTGSAEASFKVWSEFILPLLDHNKTFGSATDKMRWLRGVHEGILSGVHGKSQAKGLSEFQGTGALAKKVSQPRVLHFETPEAAFKYNQEYGSRSLLEGIQSDIRRGAHTIGMLENFGPNPQMMFDRIMRRAREKARTLPDDARHTKSLKSPFIEMSFNQLTGELDIPVNPTLAGITRGLLAHSTLARLGGIVLSAIPDKAFLQAAMTFQGIGRIDALLGQFNIGVPRTAAEISRLNLIGAGLSGWQAEIGSRFTSVDNRSGTLFKLQQGFFKINGMAWWDDVHKGAAAKMTSSWLAQNSNLRFSDLPTDLQKVLSLYDYTPLQWDAIRRTVYTAENGHSYITPDQVRNLGDDVIDGLIREAGDKVTGTNRLRARDSLEIQLRTYILDQVNDAVVTPGNKSRTVANLGTQAGTPLGTAARILTHLKQFPITVWNRVVLRELYNIGSGGLSLKNFQANLRMLELIASTTILGYLSSAVKDALRGRTPKRMFEEDGTFNPKTLINSMQRGGGLGIYGDLLFTEYDRSYRSALSVAAGPIFGQANELIATSHDLIHGRDISRSAEKLTLGNTPYINLFYIRPILDYIILWNLQEMVNPGSLRRMERSVEKKNKQGFFIRPSEVIR